MRAPILAAAAGLLAAGGAAGAPAGFTVESRGTRATVSARPVGDPAGGLLEVSVESGSRSASWEYRNLFLDAGSGAPAAEILMRSGRDYLFVRAYSGTAGCCWTMLVFDLAELRPLGAQLASRSSIELVRDRYGCEIGAIDIPAGRPGPADSSRGAGTFHCFDGQIFREERTGVSTPSQGTGGGQEQTPTLAGGIPEFFRGQWEPLTARCQPDGMLTIDDRRLRFAAAGAPSLEPRVVSATDERVDLVGPNGGGRGYWRLERVELRELKGIVTIRVQHSQTGFDDESAAGCIYTRHEVP